jgi:hypothetical protein
VLLLLLLLLLSDGDFRFSNLQNLHQNVKWNLARGLEWSMISKNVAHRSKCWRERFKKCGSRLACLALSNHGCERNIIYCLGACAFRAYRKIMWLGDVDASLSVLPSSMALPVPVQQQHPTISKHLIVAYGSLSVIVFIRSTQVSINPLNYCKNALSG